MSIIKNCTEVWCRLFDHSPFIHSELNSFVKDFEESRQDREIVNLLDVLNNECEIANQCDNIISTKNITLESLKDKVNECFRQADKILNSEKAEQTKNILEKRKKRREEEWRKYKLCMEPKYINLDIQFKKELENVKKFYENKENQLK